VSADAPAGIDAERVGAWLSSSIEGLVAPFHYEAIAGGHSNLTFCVTDAAGRRVVLRRPPLSHALASAHDMAREHRIIAALAGTAVPVPSALGLCTDESVNGAPFYVMGHVEGHVVRDVDTARRVLDPAARDAAGDSLVSTLAAIHAVDPTAVGLGELGRHEGYIVRQLKRWHGQWHASKTRELPAIDRVHATLAAHVPEQGPASIVHGDYRLDNCIVDDSGRVVAVLDWELCTLGDPMADLGLLMVYWTGPNDEPSANAFAATRVEGFPDREEIARRYAAVSGRDIASLDYYVAFAYWKLACIIEGVYARYLAGAMGAIDPASLDAFRTQVETAVDKAERLLASLH
jgi:aminoglycoside phosphotransferase (APT) family kinase protein